MVVTPCRLLLETPKAAQFENEQTEEANATGHGENIANEEELGAALGMRLHEGVHERPGDPAEHRGNGAHEQQNQAGRAQEVNEVRGRG
jgi:hypothetical protein